MIPKSFINKLVIRIMIMNVRSTITPSQIRELRMRLGETAVEFGKRFGVKRRTITYWESGEHTPDTHHTTILDRMYKNIDRLPKKIDITPELIRSIRRDLGDSMEQFARRLNAPLNSVWKWESGKGGPSRANAAKLRELYEQIMGELKQ